jgi:hypothetical protein
MLRGLDFRPVTLEDGEVLSERLRAAAFPLCEYTFTTLLCWRECNRTVWAADRDWLYLRFDVEGRERYLCPVGTGDPRPAVEACMDDLAARGHAPAIDMVPERVLRALPPRAVWAEPDKPNFDYYYAREDLATLAGRRYSRKRNHIKHFEESCPATFTPIGERDVPDCLCFADEWRAGVMQTGNPWIDYETEALRICLAHLDRLPVTGRVLRVNGRVAGLAIGEELTPDTFVVHYEKAARDCDGVYPFIAREFARIVPERFAWLNREQDMGVENLRHAKEQWFPARLESAFTLTPEAPAGAGIGVDRR